jgi:hypothetical protein
MTSVQDGAGEAHACTVSGAGSVSVQTGAAEAHTCTIDFRNHDRRSADYRALKARRARSMAE